MALLLVVGVIAIGLRLPHLQMVPHLTDETTEVLWAYDIAFHGARPLTHTDAYDGPVWPYALALALRTFGSSASLPRLFAFALGLATIAATSILAALLAAPGRRFAAGLLAGLILAVTFSHAMVASRVAWSNNSTPLWTTLLASFLVVVPRQPRAAWTVTAGLLAGLALQSHPSAAVFLVGSAIWFLSAASRRASLRSPVTWLAPVTALVAFSPVILQNVRTGFSSFGEAAASRNTPAGLELSTWLWGVGAAWLQLGRSMVGGYDLDGAVVGLAPLAAAYSVLAVAALLALARLGPTVGRRLPAIVVATSLAGLPLGNTNWQGLLESRYLGFVWPLVASAIAVVITTEACTPTPDGSLCRSGQLGQRDAAVPATAGRARLSTGRWQDLGHASPLARLGLAVVGSLLLALPTWRIWWFDTIAARQQFTSARLWHMLALLEVPRDGQLPVLVDRELKAVRWRAGGQPRRAVEYLLTLEGIPFVRAPVAKMNHLLAENGRYYLFLAGPSAEALVSRHRLLELDVQPRPGEEPWGLYWAPGGFYDGELGKAPGGFHDGELARAPSGFHDGELCCAAGGLRDARPCWRREALTCASSRSWSSRPSVVAEEAIDLRQL